MASTTYSRADYVLQGLHLLVTDGPRALTAQRVTTELGTTTGSFYWHFRSVAEFHGALRKYWRDVLVIGLVKEVLQAELDTLEQTLGALEKRVRESDANLVDDAMRIWAKSNAETAKVVREMDRWRLETLQQFLGSDEEAAAQAGLMLAAWQGTAQMKDTDRRFGVMNLAGRTINSP